MAAPPDHRAWTTGERGPHVRAYQGHLVALGYNLPESTNHLGEFDGIVGPETLYNTAAHVWANFARRGDVDRVYGKAAIPEWVRLYIEEAAAALQEPDIDPRNTGLQHIGAWAGRSALRPNTWRSRLHVALDSGLTSVSLMLNDNTGRRRGGRWVQNLDWHLFESKEQIVKVARAYRDQGIRVTLTSWMRPDVAFLNQMFDQLFDMQELSGAERTEGDAEEPWTTERYDSHVDCLRLVERRLADRPGEWGVTAIVYHHRAKIGPLIRMGDVFRGQAYATKRQTASHLQPGRIITTTRKIFTRRYPEQPLSKLEPAIALYDRSGAGGMTAVNAIRADLRTIERTPELTATCGWSLHSLRRSRELRAELSRWRFDIDARQEAA